ncbi:MAG: hypothetical protein CW716_10970 [Candidatus Bathyarchaeum sp.]|nr:MAG: hypothetical protein CW716_10970 [Candidatus Bathyarchaeum sp.]
MSIYILNAQNGEQNKKITFTTKYREFFTAEAVALSSNGNFVALIDTLYMYVFDTMTGSQISKMIYAGSSVGGSFSVSHAGDYIGVSYMKTRSITFGYEYYYKTYVLKKGDNEIIWESVAPDNYTSNSNQRALTLFSADSNTFLALTNTRLTLFDSETGVQLFSKNDAFSSKVTSAAISSDGTYILVGCEDETVYLLDQTGTILWSHNSLGSQVAASYDFETIAVSSKYSITVLDLQGNTTWTYTFP